MLRFFLLCLPALLWAQSDREGILREFTEFLSIPNVASDTQNIRRNAELLKSMMERRGIRTKLLEVEGSPPVVYGELLRPGATRTLMFYAHYDGQPVNPAEWSTGNPFQPVLKGDRLYGRSTSDDKAAIMAMLAAVDRLGAKTTSKVRFFFDGEEEAGSPHLSAVVSKYRDDLQADLWLMCDGPVHQSGRQQVFFGVRGIAAAEVTVYGATRELHSGHYGGWSPNPAVMLSHLVASMRNEDGRVLIDGFYDRVEPLSDMEGRALAAAPDIDTALREELGLARTEGSGEKIDQVINQPTLNIRGLRSADTGPRSRNVVPASATASIDMRLVSGLSPQRALDLLEAHVRRQGYHVVSGVPDAGTRKQYTKIATVRRGNGYPAAKTPMNLPIARQAVETIQSVAGPVVQLPTLGGSVPLYIFTHELKAPFLGVPIANHDNNQHAANENIRLDRLWAGIDIMAALMTMRP